MSFILWFLKCYPQIVDNLWITCGIGVYRNKKNSQPPLFYWCVRCEFKFSLIHNPFFSPIFLCKSEKFYPHILFFPKISIKSTFSPLNLKIHQLLFTYFHILVHIFIPVFFSTSSTKKFYTHPYPHLFYQKFPLPWHFFQSLNFLT